METPKATEVPQNSDAPAKGTKASGPVSEPVTAPPPPSTQSRNIGNDARDDINRPVPGWPQLAWLVGKYPPLESFQTFRDLNVKSLFYYQAELETIRKELHSVEWDDYRASSDDNRSAFARNVDFLLFCRDDAENSPEQLPEQWKLILRMRGLLKEYSTH